MKNEHILPIHILVERQFVGEYLRQQHSNEPLSFRLQFLFQIFDDFDVSLPAQSSLNQSESLAFSGYFDGTWKFKKNRKKWNEKVKFLRIRLLFIRSKSYFSLVSFLEYGSY